MFVGGILLIFGGGFTGTLQRISGEFSTDLGENVEVFPSTFLRYMRGLTSKPRVSRIFPMPLADANRLPSPLADAERLRQRRQRNGPRGGFTETLGRLC